MADSIKFARERLEYERFENSEETERFIRVMDRLFDVMNVCSPHGRGFKAPISIDSLVTLSPFLIEAKEYISTLCNVSGIPLINTQRNIGFIGLLINIDTIQRLIVEKLETNSWRYILTYKFSQDHLELFFNCIRRAGNLIF